MKIYFPLFAQVNTIDHAGCSTELVHLHHDVSYWRPPSLTPKDVDWRFLMLAFTLLTNISGPCPFASRSRVSYALGELPKRATLSLLKIMMVTLPTLRKIPHLTVRSPQMWVFSDMKSPVSSMAVVQRVVSHMMSDLVSNKVIHQSRRPSSAPSSGRVLRY